MSGFFVDISVFNGTNIDWNAYKQWSKMVDGISRVAMRASYGTGYIDDAFSANHLRALSSEIDEIIYYHYAYPQFNSAVDEAEWMYHVLGNTRSQDILMLDFEENVNQATSDWAYNFLTHLKQISGKTPGIYSYLNLIQTKLQDSRLATFPLWLAEWNYNPTSPPPCPKPWSTYDYWQYSDNGQGIPGIPGTVDLDLYRGEKKMYVPVNWHDEMGTKLVAPNGHYVVLGFRDHILNNPNWKSSNMPLEEEHSSTQIFVDCQLKYTPATGVYMTPIGYLYLEALNKIADLQKGLPTDDIKALRDLCTKILGEVQM